MEPVAMTSSTTPNSSGPIVHQGQFGEYTITQDDRRGVIIYRAGLGVAALSFAAGATIALWPDHTLAPLAILTPLYTLFSIGLGVSLLTIHIYLAALHRTLQVFWLIGSLASIWVAHTDPEPFVVTVYSHPLTLLGVGFTFAALAGIFFKEAFCFNRLETKLLTPIVPLVLLGHMAGVLPAFWETELLAIWAALFVIFAIRKGVQPIDPDIGDKSVFAYLEQKRSHRSLA